MLLYKFIASWLLSATTTNAFAPVLTAHRLAHRPLSPFASTASPLMEESSMITPEGFGFSAPVRRILKESGRGYHKAKASDTVIDVMQAITAGAYDVALVYDEKELVGLFTETDYIRVSGIFFSSRRTIGAMSQLPPSSFRHNDRIKPRQRKSRPNIC